MQKCALPVWKSSICIGLFHGGAADRICLKLLLQLETFGPSSGPAGLASLDTAVCSQSLRSWTNREPAVQIRSVLSPKQTGKSQSVLSKRGRPDLNRRSTP